MRVLHLPLNIASQMSTVVSGLRELGVEARGIAYGPSVLNDSAGIDVNAPSTGSAWAGMDDGEHRRDFGICGRRYVEQVHYVRAAAGRLLRGVFQPLMSSTRLGTHGV